MDLDNDDGSIFGDNDPDLHPGLIGNDLHLLCPFPGVSPHPPPPYTPTHTHIHTPPSFTLPPDLQPTWQSLQAAEEAVQKYARHSHFEVIRRSTKTFREKDGLREREQERERGGEMRLVHLVCSRSGKPSSCYGKKLKDTQAAEQNGERQKKIHTKKCECPCKILLVRDTEDTNWYVKTENVDLSHNHILRLKGEPPLYLSQHKKRVFKDMLAEYE
ncbi:hypothetical protein EON65_59120, partial [archaeon]